MSRNVVNVMAGVFVAVVLSLTGCGGGDGGDGGDNSPNNATPVANAGSAQNATVGSVVFLDGSASSDADGDALSYQWTLTTKPTDSAVYFDATDSAKPTLANIMAGTYVLALVVNDDVVNSAPSTVTVTVVPAVGPVSAREPVTSEIQYLVDSAVKNIPLWLRSPSTFKLAGEPTWSYYETIDKPGEGAVTVDFDSQNGFGATIRTQAICPANWDTRGFWRNTMQSNLALCIFY